MYVVNTEKTIRKSKNKNKKSRTKSGLFSPLVQYFITETKMAKTNQNKKRNGLLWLKETI